MPPFRTDQPLWYNVGIFGELGYAVPNFGNDGTTLNSGIYYLVDVIGRNLSALMHHADADLRTPPSINVLQRLHKLIIRGRTIMGSRDVEPHELNMESHHAAPAPAVHLIYPVPYFKVRNRFLREYCGYILDALGEAMQHTENRRAYEISTAFSGLIGQYLHRVYRLMATELFNVDAELTKQLDFTLNDEQLTSYNPAIYFTQTEMIDTVPPLEMVPSEDDIHVLTDGIPATQLVGLSRYPGGAPVGTDGGTDEVTKASTTGSGSFSPRPGV